MFDQKRRANNDVPDGARPTQGDGEKEFDTVLQNTASQRQGSITSVHDAVFGDVTEGGPNYRSVCQMPSFLLCLASLRRGLLTSDTSWAGWVRHS